MKAYFNNRWIEDDVRIPLNDRALQFGDGIFETMIVKNDNVRFLKEHIKRLKEGAQAISLDLDSLSISTQHLTEVIKELMLYNHIRGNARVKLQIWRKPSKNKGYRVGVSEANMLIIVSPYQPFEYIVQNNVSFSEKVFVMVSPTSKFKTLSSLPYVLAAVEQQERATDDLVLLDNRGFISESIMSNVFWIKNDVVYTPSLNTGCIQGIMRNKILNKCKDLGLITYEVEERPETLVNADIVFSANVAGFYLFKTVETQLYNVKNSIVKRLITSIGTL